MMNFLLVAGLLTTTVAMVLIAVRMVRRRPLLHSHSATDQLGTVSQHWLTTHRAER